MGRPAGGVTAPATSRSTSRRGGEESRRRLESCAPTAEYQVAVEGKLRQRRPISSPWSSPALLSCRAGSIPASSRGLRKSDARFPGARPPACMCSGRPRPSPRPRNRARSRRATRDSGRLAERGDSPSAHASAARPRVRRGRFPAGAVKALAQSERRQRTVARGLSRAYRSLGAGLGLGCRGACGRRVFRRGNLDLSGDESYSFHGREFMVGAFGFPQAYQDYRLIFHQQFLGRLQNTLYKRDGKEFRATSHIPPAAPIAARARKC